MSRSETRNVFGLKKVLDDSSRIYQHLTLHDSHFTGTESPAHELLECFKTWKSLKLSNSSIPTLSYLLNMFENMSATLEEIELTYIGVDKQDTYQTLLSLPHLKRLKFSLRTGLAAYINCTKLEVLDMIRESANSATLSQNVKRILTDNKSLADLSLTYDMLELIFNEPFNLKLKKLEIKKLVDDSISDTVKQNFQDFLLTQKNCLEEATIEWFSGSPPRNRRRSPSPDDHRFLRGGGFIIRFERHNREPAIPNYENDVTVRTLGTIFQEFRAIRKLVICDKRGYVTDSECRSIDAVNLVPNDNITELRLRFDRSAKSDILFKKLIDGCPNLKNLYTRELDQSLLEYCSQNLKHLEFIFTVTLKTSELPSEEIKFPSLKRLNFCECIIGNHPEINSMTSAEQKQTVIKLLNGETEAKEKTEMN
jgi:hypothetical protein